MLRLFKLNNVDLSQVLYVEDVQRTLLSPRVTWGELRKSQDILVDRSLGKKEILLTVRASANDYESLQAIIQDVAPLLNTQGIVKLELFDRPGRYDLVTLTQPVTFQQIGNTAQAQIGFMTSGTYQFGQEKIESFTLTADQQASITITGTAPVEPVIRITGFTADESATITFTTQSDALELNYNPSAGSIIVIDSENGDVKFGNGTTAMPYLTLASKWVKWEPGSRTFSVNRACTVQVTYTERWVG